MRSILKVHKNLGAICDSIIDDYLAGDVERVSCSPNCPVESDCVPQYLAHVMEPDFFCHDIARILQMTGIHKFNTKVYDLDAMAETLKEIEKIHS